MTAAETIVEGGTQYLDTWDNKPPLIIWFYSGFVWLFGSYALTAIRIFTCIYLFVTAVVINQLVTLNKLLKNFSLLPGFLFLVLCSVPWYAQEMNGELLMILPVVIAFYQLTIMNERSGENSSSMFLAGLLLGISFMIKYQAILLFIGLLVAYLVVFTPRIKEVFSFFSGFGLSNALILLLLYFSGGFAEFWDIGVVYNLDYILIGKNPNEQINALANLWQYTQLWGILFILSMIGFGYYRINYFTHSIQLRKVDTILMVWYIFGVLTIAMGAGRMYLHYFILAVPPLAVYASKFFELKMRRIFRDGSLLAGLAIPVFTYGIFLISAFPNTFSFVDPFLTDNGWVYQFRSSLGSEHILSHHIKKEKVRNGILVLDFEPEIYQRLDVPCATKYTNFSIAYFKFEAFPHHKDHRLISATETSSDLFKEFRSNLPEYIIDRQENSLFPHLKEKLPLLFGQYNEKLAGKYKIYSLN